jgi:hypothetical protein
MLNKLKNWWAEKKEADRKLLEYLKAKQEKDKIKNKIIELQILLIRANDLKTTTKLQDILDELK